MDSALYTGHIVHERFLPKSHRFTYPFFMWYLDLDEIDPVYFDTAYHVAPDTNPKPYVLLAQAMEKAGKVAIGRFVMRNKQYTAAIRAEDGRRVEQVDICPFISDLPYGRSTTAFSSDDEQPRRPGRIQFVAVEVLVRDKACENSLP